MRILAIIALVAVSVGLGACAKKDQATTSTTISSGK